MNSSNHISAQTTSTSTTRYYVFNAIWKSTNNRRRFRVINISCDEDYEVNLVSVASSVELNGITNQLQLPSSTNKDSEAIERRFDSKI